jgi:hypothetical protein
MIKVDVKGINQTLAHLAGMGKQVRFAAKNALNNVAFAVNAEVKNEMKRAFKGGATPYTLRAFKVEKATKENLTATVALRKDSAEGGTNYTKMLRHLFTSGTRDWKRMEGLLRGRKLMPDGYMAVPGADCPLDSRGNIRRDALAEMLGVLRSSIRNLRVGYRHSTRQKVAKQIGYFIIWPGQKSHLHPGIWRRIEQGSYKSAVLPRIMFVRRGHWRQVINLQGVGEGVVRKKWQAEFTKEYTNAMRSAR